MKRARKVGGPLQRNRAPVAIEMVEGAVWPAEWHIYQCPYAEPRIACVLGGSPCRRSRQEKIDMLAGSPNTCQYKAKEEM